MKKNQQNDITVLGGGLAGLSFALQCRQKLPDATITVLEKRAHPVPEAAHKVGESTVEVGAHYFDTVLGLKQHIVDDQLPKLGLRFFFPNGDNSRIEERLELGGSKYAPCPSYQLDRGRFENYLADCCLEKEIRFVDQATIKSVQLGKRSERHQVTYDLDGQSNQVESSWIIDASGRRAFLKRQLGLQKESPHVGNAAWFRFSKQIKVDDWSTDETWGQGHVDKDKTARWYSTNHLMGKGYWVWLIPLSSGSTSLGIVAAEEFHSISDFNSFDKALAWLEKHEPQCADAVRENREHLQDFRAIKRYAVECEQVFSGQRWGITGEAGFFHDPFYSPGSDFIAFANTFLTDLVHRDLTGKGFRMRAYSYDRIFKRFYHGTSTAYQDQYQMFGNPTVMPVKILWDYLTYWSINAFIFMHDRMCDQTMYVRNFRKLNRLSSLNHKMQQFFRDWHTATEHIAVDGMVDMSQMPLIREMNRRLGDEMDTPTFFRRFAANLVQLERIAAEIIEHAGLEGQPTLRLPKHNEMVRNNGFERVLNPSQREPVTEQSLVNQV